ncbi:MAG: hypothetical protein ACI4XJ_00715 [Eubacteriales bacterium]
MDSKKSKNFTFIVSVAASVLFTAMLLTPFVLLVTTGQDDVVLEQEKQYSRPDFSVSDFASGEFQNNFELWFSTKYPLRSSFVTAYRQLQFDTSNIGFDISTVFLPKAPVKEEKEESRADTLESDTAAVEETEPAEPEFTYSDFNELYAEINERLYNRTPVEPTGYKGTEQVIIGKSGYCYENGYINEMYGYTQKYANCTDEWLADRAEKLEYIQRRLGEMGIAFTLIFSPSKASEYEEYIPEWYKAQYTSPENYVRPVERLRPLLDEKGINYIYCADLYDEIGLDETFPLTGIHWNKLAAVESLNALLRNYEEHTGKTCRKLNITGIIEQKTPSGFGNSENDIFTGAYSGLSTKDAIIDEYYYVPEIEVVDSDAPRINVLMQGGSFCWDLKHYMQMNKLSTRFKQFYYNTWQGNEVEDPFKAGDEVWERLLDKIDYVIFECNEQMVCQMGCNAPRWAAADREPADTNCNDVYTSLYTYLKSIE